ncbi:hypothetical protein BDN72DRAFT_860044 [Pluteus cervinus]|uniref:Uncharacterized protein n=1 Tax=Pluteus cervinus TaxID=181527 RepID=A0ACD3AKF2_9AGAR|nr:hypothetical protein BDN72DRAFT_860044 [Pluteus cervinus]
MWGSPLHPLSSNRPWVICCKTASIQTPQEADVNVSSLLPSVRLDEHNSMVNSDNTDDVLTLKVTQVHEPYEPCQYYPRTAATALVHWGVGKPEDIVGQEPLTKTMGFGTIPFVCLCPIDQPKYVGMSKDTNAQGAYIILRSQLRLTTTLRMAAQSVSLLDPFMHGFNDHLSLFELNLKWISPAGSPSESEEGRELPYSSNGYRIGKPSERNWNRKIPNLIGREGAWPGLTACMRVRVRGLHTRSRLGLQLAVNGGAGGGDGVRRACSSQHKVSVVIHIITSTVSRFPDISVWFTFRLYLDVIIDWLDDEVTGDLISRHSGEWGAVIMSRTIDVEALKLNVGRSSGTGGLGDGVRIVGWELPAFYIRASSWAQRQALKVIVESYLISVCESVTRQIGGAWEVGGIRSDRDQENKDVGVDIIAGRCGSDFEVGRRPGCRDQTAGFIVWNSEIPPDQRKLRSSLELTHKRGSFLHPRKKLEKKIWVRDIWNGEIKLLNTLRASKKSHRLQAGLAVGGGWEEIERE